MPPTIAILPHKHDGFKERVFFLREMARVWSENGFTVHVLADPSEQADADLAIMHIDLTVVPEEYLVAAERFPRVLNGDVRDVSKRVISENILSRGDEYSGPVIVKTNRNYGGASEARLAAMSANAGDGLSNKWRFQHWSHQEQLSSSRYPVLDSIAEVPPGVWRNEYLIVERFLPERSDDFYCLRTWVFFGDKETNSICYANEPIIKSKNVIRREPVKEVPDELRKIREKLKFDFGKFDYAISDGCVVLYDANPTPTLGQFGLEKFKRNIEILAEGIKVYL